MMRAIVWGLALGAGSLVAGCSFGRQEAEEARAEAAKARAEGEALRSELARLRADVARLTSKSVGPTAPPVAGGDAKQGESMPRPAVRKVRPADYPTLQALMKALPEDRKPRQASADQRQDAVGEWFAKNAPNKVVRFRATYAEGQRDSGRNIMTFWETKEELGLPGAIVLPMAIFSPRIDQEDELKTLRPGTERTVQGRLVMVDVRPSGETGKFLLEIRLGEAEFADR